MTTDTTTAAAPSTNLPAKRAPAKRAQPKATDHHRQAAQQAVDANSTHLDLNLGGAELHLTLPPVDKLAFYAGLAAAATFGIVEWPIALLTGIGHALSDDRRNRTLRALGEALDAV